MKTRQALLLKILMTAIFAHSFICRILAQTAPSSVITTTLSTVPRQIEAKDIISSGGFLFTAGTRSTGAGSLDLIVAKYTTAGSLVASANRDYLGFDDIPVKIKADGSGNIYVLCTAGNSAGNRDLWLVRYNSNLTYVWAAALSGAIGGDDSAVDLIVSGTSVFVLGNNRTNTNGSNVTLARYTTAGVLQNQLNFQFANNTNDEVATELRLDGGFLYISGYRFNGTDRDGMLLKFNTTLSPQFTVAWSPGAASTQDEFNTITTDGSFIYVAGSSFSAAAAKDMTVAKFNKSTGAFVNYTFISSANNEEFKKIVLNGTSLYVMGNVEKPGSPGKFFIMVMKYNTALTAAASPWPRTYNPASDSYVGNDMKVQTNGTTLVAGTAFKTSSSGVSYTSSLTLVYSSAGAVINNYMTPNNAGCNTLESSGNACVFHGSSDLDYAIAGEHKSWAGTINNFKANRVEILLPPATPAEAENDVTLRTAIGENLIHIYPNPASTELFMNSNMPVDEIRFIDVDGSLVRTIPAGASQSTIDVSDLLPGTYILQFVQGKNISTRRFVRM